MQLTHVVSRYRWPIFLGGILVMSVVANGVLVFVATRPSTPAPIEKFYEKSLQWDADAAVLAASRRLSWDVRFDIPAGEEYAVAASRPVDVTVRDEEGQPVTSLVGRLVAVRPADPRLNGDSELVELPHSPGTYRTLARLPVPGVWELNLDVHRGETRFVHTERIEMAGSETP